MRTLLDSVDRLAGEAKTFVLYPKVLALVQTFPTVLNIAML